MGKRLKTLVAAAMMAALSFGLAGQAQAVDFIIDDFNVVETTLIADTDGRPVLNDQDLPKPPGTVGEGSIIMGQQRDYPNPGDWTRDYSVESVTGSGADNTRAFVCSNCAAFQVNTAASANGNVEVQWDGPDTTLGPGTGLSEETGPIDLSGFDEIMFEYASDQDGVNFTFTFTDGNNVTASVDFLGLPETPPGAIPEALTPVSGALPGGVDYTNIVQIEMDITFDNINTDLLVDNVKLPDDGEGFKCYFGKQRPPFNDDNPQLPNPVASVQLTDQFQNRLYNAIFLHELCNDAVKNFEPTMEQPEPPLIESHLTCYKVRPLSGEITFLPPTVEIETENFGEDTFRLGQPWELCIPAEKTVLPDGEPQGSQVGDEYLCYTAASTPINETVTLDDQFGREEVVVTKLEQFCTPVGKNDPDFVPPVEIPDDPTTWSHLACYSIREISGPDLPIDVRVVDQFSPAGGVTQTVERPRQWCERARKANMINR